MLEYIGKNRMIVDIRRDNQGALALVKNSHLHEQSKYINACYYYIYNLAEKKRLKIEYVPTAKMFADGLTKLLTRIAFERFRGQLGVATD